MPIHVSAILLAAGASKRMGQTKQLLSVGDKPVIVRSVETIISSGITDIVAVIPSHDGISRAIDTFSVKKVINNSQESEMAQSVRLGLDAAQPSCRAILIFPADHPLVLKDTLCTLIQAHQDNRDNIIIPLHKGKRGHPTLFPTTILKDIYAGFNLREIINRSLSKVSYLEVKDKGIILDMDTEEDYKKLCEYYAQNES
jgi:molybdenum cofactor cytidylyltransferase